MPIPNPPGPDARLFRCASCGRVNKVDGARLASQPKCGQCGSRLEVSGRPIAVSDDALDALLRDSPVPVVVDFWAAWCGPCRMLGPVLEQLGQKHAGRLIVAKVDTEQHQRHARALRVEGIPAVHVFSGGRPVASDVGYKPLAAWEQLVAPFLR